jgi:hypothetical protein
VPAARQFGLDPGFTFEAQMTDHDLPSVLAWCAKNEVNFKITNRDGPLAITAQHGAIRSEYHIGDGDVGSEAVGQAVWAALFAVQHGSEFNTQFGIYPPVREGDSRDKSDGGEVQSGVPAEPDASAPNLRTGFKP